MTIQNLQLKRIASSEKGVFGVLVDDNETPICLTIERPWLNNAKGVSCIPAGKYKVAAYSSKKYPNVWEIKNVPNRSHILIHAGNTMRDLQGCVAVGNVFFSDGVLQSQKTLDSLRQMLPDKFDLEVINCF